MTSDFEMLLRSLTGNQTAPQTPPVPQRKPTDVIPNNIGELLNTPKGRSDLELLFKQLMGSQEVAPDNSPVDNSGSIMDIVLRQSKPQSTMDSLFSAINHAEMRGQEDHWIRTKHKPEGDSSTAYGPLQLTTTLAKDYLDRKGGMFSDDEREYLQKFVVQGQKFLDHDRGELDDEKYGYGGQGELTTKKDKKMYESVTKKMLADIADRNNNDPDQIWREWRFGASKKGKDKEYKSRFYDALGL
jgi:hypothetical protein